MFWTSMDSWIVVAAALAGISCALVGAFLVLEKMSMMGDAISHAVLPGIVVAFIISGTKSGGLMFVGATVAGVLTAVLVQLIRRHGRLEEGAAMGVVFTVLFAIGLILVEQAAHHVDIHPDHVLFGAAELVPLYTVDLAGFTVPRGVLTLTIVLIVNLTVVILLFKELRLVTFDPALATTLGINARWMNYLLMALVALTAMASFEVVGSILVIGMIIVPGAIAHLLTRRLVPFLLVSVAVAVVAAAGGHVAAITVPPLFGYEDTSTAGSMTTLLGVLFFLAFLFAPDGGVVSRGVSLFARRLRITMQDVLGLLIRGLEKEPEGGNGLSVARMIDLERSPFSRSTVSLHLALTMLRLGGRVIRKGGVYRLTDAGTVAARALLRSHRLWERFFFDEGKVVLPELHPAADYLEHYTDEDLREALAAKTAKGSTDPRGNPIPD